MSVRWIEHKKVEILYFDFRLRSPKQMLEILKQGFNVIDSTPEKIPSLFDYRNVPVNAEFMRLAQNYYSKHFNNEERIALLGIQGIKKLLFENSKGVSHNRITAFDSEVEAKNYLAEL